MKVGIIGVGQMGMPMLERLRGAGLDVTFRARRPEVIEAAEALGAVAAPDFGDRDVVIVCMFDDAQLAEIGAAVLGEMRRGSVFVNHTTARPETMERLAAQAVSLGVGVLDSAISGGAHDILAGALVLLVGGDEAVLEAARPALAAYSEPIIHVGRVGDGQRVKLVNNALFGAQLELLADAERVATELGMDPVLALTAIGKCSAASRVLDLMSAAGGAAPLQAAAGKYIRKDVATVEAVASELGIDLGRLGTALYRHADLEAIKQLKARYFRFIDTKDWASFRELFTEDCQHHLPEGAPIPFMTNDDYFAMIEQILTPATTTHHGHTPEITFSGEREAEGIWAMFDYVQGDGPRGRTSIMGWGHYIETYRKGDDGRWRISSKRNERLRLDEVPWTVPEG
jgi:3-hydroxyisobutyrate dehydrogenase-like beta-hydroxyacid dehydrogenase